MELCLQTNNYKHGEAGGAEVWFITNIIRQ
jgi:hypothetical protein